MNSDHVATIREALEVMKRAESYRLLFAEDEEKAAEIQPEVEAAASRIDAALAWLEEDAGWEVVPDGEVSSFMYVDNGGKLLGVYAGDDYTDWYATEDLPDHIRPCRKRPPAQG